MTSAIVTVALVIVCGVGGVCGVGACGSTPSTRNPQERSADSAPAIAALRASQFESATKEASTALAKDARSAQAAAVRAIATYQLAAHELVSELGKVLQQGLSLKLLDHAGGRMAWQKFLDKLVEVDRDLAIVAADPSFTLELCIACWERDYNHSGQIDERDRKMLEIELDDKGESYPDGDPRRRPTFKFDVGDAEWARAMISFQRAFVELVLSYQWSDLDKLFFGDGDSTKLTIKLGDKQRVTRARELILNGLAAAERCRTAYLAETDDDREWVPNPRQRSHPIPLAIDDSIYATWSGVVGDVRRMLESKEGISLREVARLGDKNSEHKVPDVYLDLGAMLSSPKDIVIDFSLLKGGGDAPGKIDHIDQLLRGLIGNGYKPTMKPSPLVRRLDAMKQQLDRGEDTFERKLRYLLWLN
ncbi:MAG: hypothetical protein H0V17_02015 [Deltaproteobacteria bacterium]|nr:hypothetical protein [Deltaproteobacteria bacterium]